MYNFIKAVCISFLCVVLCSCSAQKKYKTEDISYETDSFSVKREKIIFDIGEECVLNSDIEVQANTWISDFEARVSNNLIKGTELPNMQIRHKVYRCTDELISMVTEKYAYINGVHGNIWWVCRNFDIKNNRYLTLSDLFYDDEYKNILNIRMEEMILENPDLYHDLWEIPMIKNGADDNFYITENTLVIFFQPYELSFYAKGVVEFPIETKDLRGYIKEEYL